MLTHSGLHSFLCSASSDGGIVAHCRVVYNSSLMTRVEVEVLINNILYPDTTATTTPAPEDATTSTGNVTEAGMFGLQR